MLDLLEHLEGHCEIINSNTDGIIVKIPSEDRIDEVKAICKEWEERTGMGLGYDFFDTMYQLNVNSYLLAKGDEYEAIKNFKTPSALDNDMPIIRKALIEYARYGTNPKKTIMECDDLIQFQHIVNVSRNFDYAVMITGREQKILDGKYFRVFASRRLTDGTIKRGKWEHVTKDLFGNETVIKSNKFAGTSDRCFIDNEDITGKKCPSYLDKEFYVTQITKILEKFGVST